MKTKLIHKTAVAFVISLAVTFIGWSPLAANAQEMRGAEHLLHLNAIKTRTEAEQLKSGDEMAMVCSKCESVTTTRVTTEKGHIKLMTPGEKHLCPGCKSTITVVGVGKGSKDEVKHVCGKCGDNSAFCCATKAGSGPTKGMEKTR